MSNDDLLCERCGDIFEIGDGLEPTVYCDLCAQVLVEELRGLLRECEPAVMNSIQSVPSRYTDLLRRLREAIA